MNNDRRREIKRILDDLDDINQRINIVLDEEDESRDNMPESLIDSERYQVSEEASDKLISASTDIENAMDTLEEIVS